MKKITLLCFTSIFLMLVPLSFGTASSFLLVDSISNTDTVPPVLCKANFGYTIAKDSALHPGKTVYFYNTSTGTNLSYSWNLGDGSHSVLQNPVHKYNVLDTLVTVCLKISSTTCHDSICKTIVLSSRDSIPGDSIPTDTVPPVLCRANFGYTVAKDSALYPGKTVYFYNTSTGTNLSYFWNLGDGTHSVLQNPVHKYNVLDTLVTVCLKISSTTCHDSICKTIILSSRDSIPGDSIPTDTIPSIICKANFNYSIVSDTLQGTTKKVYFNNLSSGINLTYLWSFGDGSYSSLKDPNHTYSLSGDATVTVCLTVSSGTACRDSICKVILIRTDTTATSYSDTAEDNSAKLASENASGSASHQNMIIVPKSADNISVRLSQSSSYYFYLINMSGKVLRSGERDFEADTDNIIDLTGVPAGVYILKLKNNSNMLNKKFVK